MALLVDADILTALSKGHAGVTKATEDYLARHGVLTLSVITKFELLRGLRVKKAARQIRWLEQLCTRAIFFLSTMP
jgi:tRNA(fMet)-specific endonuclease VapC